MAIAHSTASDHSFWQDLITQSPLSDAARAYFEAELLRDPDYCDAFGIDVNHVSQIVETRSHYLYTLYPTLQHFCQTQLHWQTCPIQPLWRVWLPLSLHLIATRQILKRPLIQGILGGQGTGKTTLAKILQFIVTQQGDRVCTLSLDDLYKTYAERQQLQLQDPRLRWRGPPGTHDIDLGLCVLQQLREAQGTGSIAVPRFDKSAFQGAGDRTTPDLIDPVDIVLFEGWFVGVRPIHTAAFDQAPHPIITAADRAFAVAMNQRLHDYLPLWDQLDQLMILHPNDYRLSRQWRNQAEQVMIASGRPGMAETEITQFVEYFWRSLHPDLFIKPLLHDANHVDLVIEIHPDHTPGKLYRPQYSQKLTTGNLDEANL